jgi:hypothetical protein
MRKSKTAIRRFIVRLTKQHKGRLKPSHVVDAARPSNSPIHGHFQWDDNAAAEAYRLIQARQLIQSITIEYHKGPSVRTAPVFVNLRQDRQKDSGYRFVVDVLSDKDKRKQLVADAKADMLYFTNKYHELSELTSVISSMRDALKTV